MKATPAGLAGGCTDSECGGIFRDFWGPHVNSRPQRTIRQLRATDCRDAPDTPGVYVVSHPPRRTPRVLRRNPAGHFKDRDPTLAVSELAARLTVNPVTLYIGKASGTSPRSTLRARLRTYLRHGAGHRAAHWGGRAIWQLADSDALTVLWVSTTVRGARATERRLLHDFKYLFGAFPFANRTG